MYERVKFGFELNALETHIDQLTMETHYGKHRAAKAPEGKLAEAIGRDLDVWEHAYY